MNHSWRLLLLLLAFVTNARATDGPVIRLIPSGKAVEVSGLDPAELAALAKLTSEADAWSKVFAVYLDKADRTLPPLLGTVRVEGAIVRFEPRFALVLGVGYRAVFDSSQIPGHKPGKPIEAKLMLPKPAPKAATVVERIYPTAKRLPENQLKFYLQFSAPMSSGDNYRHIHLLDATGKPIELAFLEIGQELWDPEGKRFTLFIDPGRIKRGLKPREDLGPVLEEGKSYTLVLDRAWTDAEGNPLKETFRKSFTVGPADEKVLDPKKWQLRAPEAGVRASLIVVLPKPLDHALLHRLVWVADAHGQRIAGTVAVDDEEKRWQFTPAQAWAPGQYRLVADTRLEDLAGNSIARPFEVDVFRPVERAVKPQTIALPFEVRSR